MRFISGIKMKKILFFLILITQCINQLSALTNWAQFSLNYFITDSKNNIEIVTSASQDARTIGNNDKFGGQYIHQVSGKINDKFSFDVNNQTFYSEISHEQRNSFMFNQIKARLFYRHEQTWLKFQINNRYYKSQETNYLNLPGLEYNTQQQMVNMAIMHFRQIIGSFNFDLYGSLRDLKYKYAVPENDDEDEWESKSASDFELNSFGKITFMISENLGIFTQAYLKDDLNKNNEMNITELGGGLEYENRLDFFNSVSGTIGYFSLDSGAVDAVFNHNIISELRYTKRFYYPLTGFISYKNHSVFDEAHSKLLRVSNLVRIHLKYSYLTEHLRDSYILAGLKYNPEKEENLIFGEFSQFLAGGLYLAAGFKYSDMRYTQKNMKIEFFFSSLKSIWIQTEITDFKKRFGQNIISLGTTLVF